MFDGLKYQQNRTHDTLTNNLIPQMASLKLAQQSQNLGHYAHAVDLYQKLLENPNLSKKEQLEISWNLSRSYRFGGHYSMALMALKKQTDGHSCFQAHFEEGASWQDLDCTLAATSCYQKALDLNPTHSPSLKGLQFCAIANQNNVSNHLCHNKPNHNSIRLLSGAIRQMGITKHLSKDTLHNTINAIPETNANSVLQYLQSTPTSDWRLNQRNNSGSAAAANRGVTAANMSYYMYIGTDLDTALPELRPLLSSALQLLPHERLLMNASKYIAGSYLDSHTDAPSGSESHERVRAFVWHLSKDFTEQDGGTFIDEESKEKYVPEWNALVSFSVPRWHSVTKMTPMPIIKERISIYGWIVIPKMQLIPSENSLQLILYQHRMVACYWPSAESEESEESEEEEQEDDQLLDIFGKAATKPAPKSRSKGGASAVARGDYIKFCVATERWKTVELDATDWSLIHADSTILKCKDVQKDEQQQDDVKKEKKENENKNQQGITGDPSISYILLFVDCVLCGHVPLLNNNTALELENLLNTAWSHLLGRAPVLRSRNAWEDRLVLAAMQFNNNRLPLLAIVVGNTTLSIKMNVKDMEKIRIITDAVKLKVFVYVTTNPNLCQAFGIVDISDCPTCVVHGNNYSINLLNSDVTTFSTSNVIEFVQRCCRTEEEEEEEGCNVEGIKMMMVGDY